MPHFLPIPKTSDLSVFKSCVYLSVVSILAAGCGGDDSNPTPTADASPDGNDAALSDAGQTADAGPTTDAAPSDAGPATDAGPTADAGGSFSPDTMNMTFEGTTLGMTASGGTGWPFLHPIEGMGMFSDGRLYWEFSDEQVFEGTRSMKVNVVNQVNSETNTVGGTVANTVPSMVGEGDEFWWRAMVYLPADHSPGTIGSSDVKWFRIYRQNSSGMQKGALEFKLGGGGDYRFGNEFGTEFHNIDAPPEDHWTTGWNAFECYAKFSATDGVVRFWRNNNLIYEFAVVTLPGGADRIWRTQFIAYWNCAMRGQCGLSDTQNDRVPQTQSPIYVDNMIATTSHSPPVNRDAAGNLFIGGTF